MTEHRSIWTYLFRIRYKMDYVEVRGVRTRYIEAGTPGRPVVVALHGTAGSLENFCANYAALSEHFHVFGIDMLGCGMTDKPDYDYLIRDYVEHVNGFLDELGLDKVSIIGVSLGSWVAAALASRHAERVEKLVMVAPAGLVVDKEEERRVAQGIRQRRSQAAAQPTWRSVHEAMAGLMLNPADLIDDLVATRLQIYSDPRMAAAMPRLLAFSIGGQDLSRDTWMAISQPILCIAAVDAPNMFLKNAYAISQLAPNAVLLELSGCDHWAQFEQPDAFNLASIAFLLGDDVPKPVAETA